MTRAEHDHRVSPPGDEHADAPRAQTFLAHHDGDGAHEHRRMRKPSGRIGGALLLVLAFAGVEALVGLLSGSLALVSDAVHMFTDGIALGLAWAAQRIARRRPSPTHSFGFERAETLAAFVNGLFYLALLAAIAYEAIDRLANPVPIRADWALPVAVLGLLINGVMLWMLHADRHEINTRAALLHVIGDFAGSVIAIVAISVAWATGWTRIDPLLSLALCVLMFVSASRIVRESSRVLMNAVPPSIAVGDVGRALIAVDGVRSVHDLHVWEIGGGKPALAAHLKVESIARWPEVLDRVRETMRADFGIEHLTLQPEAADDPCEQEHGESADTDGGDRGSLGASADGASSSGAPADGASSSGASPSDAQPRPDAAAREIGRLREQRDAAIAGAIEAEQDRDLSHGVALSFEREFDAQRRALATQVHGEIAEHATAIRALAATVESRLAQREPSLAQLARLMMRSTDALLASARTLATRIRPEPLEHGGLLEGLRTLVADWRLRRPQARFELLVEPGDDARFGLATPRIEAAAWRVASDAIEYAVAQAGASTVVVSARVEGGRLTLQISDDGRALAGSAREDAGVLRSMRERAHGCGGTLQVGPGESGGAEVLLTMPWRRDGGRAG